MRLLVSLLLFAGAARAQELHLEWSEEPVGAPVPRALKLLPETPSGFGAPASQRSHSACVIRCSG